MMYLPRTWPVGIPLQTDESFSSWFARIAWAHGATPSELYRIALPGGRIGGIDLDRHACDDLILNLSWHAGPARLLTALFSADANMYAAFQFSIFHTAMFASREKIVSLTLISSMLSVLHTFK